MWTSLKPSRSSRSHRPPFPLDGFAGVVADGCLSNPAVFVVPPQPHPSVSRTHTNSKAALARGDRDCLPEGVDLDREGRELWLAVRGEAQHAPLMAKLRNCTPIYWLISRLCRESDRSDPIIVIERIIFWLAKIGWPEERLRLIELRIRARIDQAYAGASAPKPEDVDEVEQRLDGIEDIIQFRRLRRRGEGIDVAPSELLREAQVREQLAGVELKSAGALRRAAAARTIAFPSRSPDPAGAAI